MQEAVTDAIFNCSDYDDDDDDDDVENMGSGNGKISCV